MLASSGRLSAATHGCWQNGRGQPRPRPSRYAVLKLLRFVADVEALPETLNPAGRIKHALLARVERVTLRANINFEDRLRAADGERAAACARDRGLDVLGMNIWLHGAPAAGLVPRCCDTPVPLPTVPAAGLPRDFSTPRGTGERSPFARVCRGWVER